MFHMNKATTNFALWSVNVNQYCAGDLHLYADDGMKFSANLKIAFDPKTTSFGYLDFTYHDKKKDMEELSNTVKNYGGTIYSLSIMPSQQNLMRVMMRSDNNYYQFFLSGNSQQYLVDLVNHAHKLGECIQDINSKNPELFHSKHLLKQFKQLIQIMFCIELIENRAELGKNILLNTNKLLDASIKEHEAIVDFSSTTKVKSPGI